MATVQNAFNTVRTKGIQAGARWQTKKFIYRKDTAVARRRTTASGMTSIVKIALLC